MTVLPEPLRETVERALRSLGRASTIAAAQAVSGGCVNHGTRLEATDGARYFLKWNDAAPAGMFEAEAAGLAELRRAALGPDGEPPGVRIPEPLAVHGADERPGWLLLDFIEPGRPRSDAHERLGRGLAAIHGRSADGVTFGWESDNWIGALPQANTPTSSWGEFWRDRRIVPQLDRARRAGLLRSNALDRLVDLVPRALASVTRPELVHGDLWNGNAFFDTDARPVLIDPAIHRADGEVDLAMSELFGGFARAFYDAYAEVRPISRAYSSHKRDLYQLYYLLVHVNLFGASYVRASEEAAARVVAALG